MEEGRAFTTRLVTGYPRLSPIERDDDIILMAQDAMKTTHLSFPRGRSLFPQKKSGDSSMQIAMKESQLFSLDFLSAKTTTTENR